ncbi:MAG: hypothetical protein Q3M24_02200 [Candidatus Electrothrix aestuarii]|uniref:Uncharacterized protein n=1 Tax=Candidatus Electrothrix aestuarii TaxID=3062594 RepID=A0AAU8LWM6_9BACT
MRQVGVQVQDIGTYLCWQTYVDDPARELGLAKLVHIAESPELGGLQHPEEIPRFKKFIENRTIRIPFISENKEGADNDEIYYKGVENDGNKEGVIFDGHLEKIKVKHEIKDIISPKSHYELTGVEFEPHGNAVVSLVPNSLIPKRSPGDEGQKKTSFKFMLQLEYAAFEGQNSIQVELKLHWTPTEEINAEIDEKNKANIENFKAEEKAAYESAFLETVKDRINAVSNIKTRNQEDLRAEERIVIYRKLIQDFLQNKISFLDDNLDPDDKTRHVVAELINSIFDVEKMLYFVAPEWWRPRLYKSSQQLYSAAKEKNNSDGSATSSNEIDSSDVDPGILDSHTTGWGDIDNTTRDSYYITEDSSPAKFGSSLGWLMQMDGDNRRNAFLNAPWVKAVIPIRPGKEKAALNWLKAVEGMNGITDEVVYHSDNPDEKDINGNPLDGQPMLDVLMDLAAKIEKKHKEGLKAGKYPNDSEVSSPLLVDEENTVTSTPIDRVYEHGFFPLENSFRANIGDNYEIFDQWVEILPTDQTVPVEVEYHPRTGRQV